MDLSGYQLLERIGEDEDRLLYRMRRASDQQVVLGITTRDTYSGEMTKAAFKREYELLGLAGEGAVRPIELYYNQGRPLLIMEDFGGVPLHQLPGRGLPHLLAVAAAAAKSLASVQQQGIVHQAIRPAHILVHPETLEVKLIGFHAAFLRDDAKAELASPSALAVISAKNQLSYMAPEQTGRFAGQADFRSDIYSLGACLYEWLGGKKPFATELATELVYSHIADRAKPLAMRDPAFPRQLSNIVSRCMEKEAELRYANAYMVYEELNSCLEQLVQTGMIKAVETVEQQLTAAPEIYGREQESLELHRLLEQRNGIVLVKGQTGIGKTAFVQKVLRSRKGKSMLISGKFELAATGFPYSAWIQAIEELVAQLLMLPNNELELWKLRISQGVGGYEQLLVNWAPKLRILLGESGEVQQLPLMEERQRFQQVLRSFIRLFADSDTPLLIFLDDLQWADEASLQLIEHLFNSPADRLQLIGTCRNEEEASTAWAKWQRNSKIPPSQLHWLMLRPLKEEAISQLLLDKLGGAISQLTELSRLVLDKTAGNPLRILSFVQYSVNQGLFRYQLETHIWEWSVRELLLLDDQPLPQSSHPILGRLAVLEEEVLTVLDWAALIGRRFELAVLIAATGRKAEELGELLHKAIRCDVLRQSEEAGQFIFLHDQLRQDCLTRISEQKLHSYHYEIGKVWKKMRDGESALFEAVFHLNKARALMTSRAEQLELAELNYEAGVRAMKSMAWAVALDYFRGATELAADTGWQDSFELTFKIAQQRVVCEFLCGERNLSYRLFEQLLQRADHDLEKVVNSYLTMIQLESNGRNYVRALEMADEALRVLGTTPPSNNSNLLHFARRWLKLKWRMRKGFNQVKLLPPLQDKRIKAVLEIFIHSNTARFETNVASWINSIFDSLELTLRYGQSSESLNAYVGMAMIHTALREYRQSYEWGILAKRMSIDNPSFRTFALNGFSQCVDTWTRYEPDMLDELIDNVDKAGLQSVSLWQVEHSVLITVSLMIHLSRPLGEVYSLLMRKGEMICNSQNPEHFKYGAVLAELLRSLIGKKDAADPFVNIDIHDPNFILSNDGKFSIFIGVSFYITQYIKHYIFGQYEEAYRYGLLVRELQRDSSDVRARIYASNDMYFHLTMAELYSVVTANERKAFLTAMRTELRVMRGFTRHCPRNYRHKYLLMKAEYARITCKPHIADRMYEQACHCARNSGFIHDFALISENACRHNIDQGRLHLARGYISQAYQAYMQWGAIEKANLVARQYRSLLFINSSGLLGEIDYEALMSSVQAISEEMHMDRLLVRLMRTLIHNAGAEKGALVFQEKGNLSVEAYAETGGEVQLVSVPLEQTMLPHAIISYVARTQETVVLNHASREGLFINIPHIRDNKVKSVLCIPMFKNDRLISLIYLENSLSAGVFTSERLDVLKLLCSQCAISIENAHLYRNTERLKQTLEEQVKERTNSLELSIRERAAAMAEASVQQDRNRIAADVHDIVGHTITSTILQIEAAKRQMNRQPAEARTRLQDVQDMLREGLNEIRGSIHMLKGTIGDNLVQSLQQLIATTEQHAGIIVNTNIAPLNKLDQTCHHVIYHALKEGLTNGIRHGKATSFRFSLWTVGEQLQFCLEDNGSCTKPVQYGFGLTAMEERVIALGGEMSIQPIPGEGCQLKIVLPYMDAKEEQKYVIS